MANVRVTRYAHSLVLKAILSLYICSIDVV
jgi:hypothetical protein